MFARLQCPPLRPNRMIFCALVAASLILLIVLFALSERLVFKLLGQPELQPPSYKHDFPLVLTWTKYFSGDFAENLLEDEEKCPFRCNFTSDKGLLNESSVIVFHSRNLHEVTLPRVRPDQLKVFYAQESPANTRLSLLRDVPPNYFNLTATYRLDSDLPIPYGIFRKKLSNKDDMAKKIDAIVSKKTKIAFQLTSNCHTHSNREAFTKEISLYLNLTSYGKCFDGFCDDRCEKEAIESHFFYFAFENSVCPNYLTEKFFRRMREGIVPVVLSRKVAERVAPAGSFVAADDFPSSRDLAEYLIFLANNRWLYERYFDWMYDFDIFGGNWGSYACQLCEAAYGNWTGTVANVYQWWFEGNGSCVRDYAARTVKSKSKIFTLAKDLGFTLLLLTIFIFLR